MINLTKPQVTNLTIINLQIGTKIIEGDIEFEITDMGMSKNHKGIWVTYISYKCTYKHSPIRSHTYTTDGVEFLDTVTRHFDSQAFYIAEAKV